MTISLKIEKNVYGGDGLGRLGDGRVCFVPGVFAGETVRAEIVERKKNFVRARCVAVDEPSPSRIRAFGDCGGLRVPGMVYADVNYAEELRLKEAQLGNFLERLGQSYSRIEVVAGRSLNYRNKVTYHVQNAGGKWLIGYRKEFSHDVVDIAEDPLAHPEINRALPSVRAGVLSLLTQGAGRMRRSARGNETVTVRWTLDDGVRWWFDEPPPGLELTERTCNLKFKVAAGGFYQVNPEIGDKLVSAVADAYAADTESAPNVTDLYCGVGVFGLCCLKRGGTDGARLVGAESAHASVAFAKRNAQSLGVKANFFCERVGGSLQRIKIGERSTVIVDPPRGGMEKNVPPFLAASAARRIFCVSCDPATLTRDLQPLVRTYRIGRVRLFDMFPRTARFETLVELEK